MTLATFSYTIGIVCFLVGIPQLLSPEKTSQWLLTLMRQNALNRTIGASFFILASLVLVQDPSVGTDVPGLVRLFAWLLLAKSLLICWWPDWRTRLVERFFAQPTLRFLHGVLAVAWGVMLLIAGRTLS